MAPKNGRRSFENGLQTLQTLEKTLRNTGGSRRIGHMDCRGLHSGRIGKACPGYHRAPLTSTICYYRP